MVDFTGWNLPWHVRLPSRATRDSSQPPPARCTYDLAGKLVARGARPARIIGQVDTSAFVRDGYVAVRGAFGEDTARACREMIWDVLRERGISPEDRATWAPPLVRINCPRAGRSPPRGCPRGCTPPTTNCSARAGGSGGPGSAAPCRCASRPRATPVRWATTSREATRAPVGGGP